VTTFRLVGQSFLDGSSQLPPFVLLLLAPARRCTSLRVFRFSWPSSGGWFGPAISADRDAARWAQNHREHPNLKLCWRWPAAFTFRALTPEAASVTGQLLPPHSEQGWGRSCSGPWVYGPCSDRRAAVSGVVAGPMRLYTLGAPCKHVSMAIVGPLGNGGWWCSGASFNQAHTPGCLRAACPG